MTHLWVTRNCNVHCKFCYLRDYPGKNPSLIELGKRLDKMKELENQITVIMGGEPTLRKDLPEIVGACNERGTFSYLVTNGTKLNKKLIDKLGKKGLDAISISIDTLKMGENPLVEYNSQEYVPEEILATLKYAEKKYGMIVFLAIVSTKLNIKEVELIIKLADKYGIFVTITAMMDPYCISNIKDKSWEKEKKEVVFSTEDETKQLTFLMEKLKKMQKQGYRILEPDDYFDRVIDLKGDKRKNLCFAGSSF